MVLTEIAEAEAVEVAFVRGVAKRAEIGVMGGYDADGPVGPHEPVELLHGADYVLKVLDHMDRGQPVERAAGERIGKPVKVGQNIGAASGIPVNSNGAGLLAYPAADVESPHLPQINRRGAEARRIHKNQK